ncbi:MAG: sulfotransferase [Vicingaceae bacterium]|nr:sulfotransferase [Vicingaceae bacterium]
MLIGSQKSGTSSLSKLLAEHPEICFSTIKEPGLFKMDNYQEKFNWYNGLFHPTPATKIIGEGSTHYTMRPIFNEVADRIFQYNPEMKFIYLMRDPVERILSEYTHNLTKNLTIYPDFESEIKKVSTYCYYGKYYYQLKPYLDLFPKNNFLLLSFEEFVADQQACFSKVCQFLNISDLPIKTQAHANASEGKIDVTKSFGGFRKSFLFKILHPLTPKFLVKKIKNTVAKPVTKPIFKENLKTQFRDLFVEDILKMEVLIGRELTEWKKK